MHIEGLKNGAATQTRTGDLRITNAPLYRLSYCGPFGVGPVHNANGRLAQADYTLVLSVYAQTESAPRTLCFRPRSPGQRLDRPAPGAA
jgi:hypothetical protein